MSLSLYPHMAFPQIQYGNLQGTWPDSRYVAMLNVLRHRFSDSIDSGQRYAPFRVLCGDATLHTKGESGMEDNRSAQGSHMTPSLR